MYKINYDFSGDILINQRDIYKLLLDNQGEINIVTNEFQYNETYFKRHGLFGKTDINSTFDNMLKYHSTEKIVAFCKKYSLRYNFEKVVISEKKTMRNYHFDSVKELICVYNMVIHIPDSKMLLEKLGITERRINQIAKSSYIIDITERIKRYFSEINDSYLGDLFYIRIGFNNSYTEFSFNEHYKRLFFSEMDFTSPDFEEQIIMAVVCRRVITNLIMENYSFNNIIENSINFIDGINIYITVKKKGEI